MWFIQGSFIDFSFIIIPTSTSWILPFWVVLWILSLLFPIKLYKRLYFFNIYFYQGRITFFKGPLKRHSVLHMFYFIPDTSLKLCTCVIFKEVFNEASSFKGRIQLSTCCIILILWGILGFWKPFIFGLDLKTNAWISTNNIANNEHPFLYLYMF